LRGFLNNLADSVKVGGYFVGCATDGDSVAALLLGEEQSVLGNDGRSETWMITKRYGSGIGASVPPSAAGLGLAIDVELIAGGTVHTEYLVSWAYLQAQLAECGLEVLTEEELKTVGLPASTQMFRDTWLSAEAAGDVFAMSESLKRLTFLNRWFVLKRRSDRRPPLPTEAPAPPVGLTESGLLTTSEAAVVGKAGIKEEGAAPAPLSQIPEEAGTESKEEAIDVIDLEEKAEEPETPEKPGPAESKEYFINATKRESDPRLGPELADWQRYMSLGTLVEIADLSDPSIKYPSIEAAIASAKYQKATDKPDLGPQLFRVDGAIHQKFEKEREKFREVDAPLSAIQDSVDAEVSMIRVASGKAKMKAYKAAWNQEAWESEAVRDTVYRAYLAQRFAVDARFRSMIEAIKAKGGQILFVNGVDPSYLGVGVRVDGSVSGGDNKVGKWMMELA
jgi:hypothetical protein